jgi:hypothetical protein
MKTKPTKKRGGRKESLSVEQVVAALRKARGIQRYAAQSLGCHRQTIANMARRHPEIQAVIQDEIEGLIDTAEGKLAEAITRGEFPAIAFFLKCRAKHRGYVERAEYTGAGGKPLLEPADLSKLSEAELVAFERILVKATGNSE